MGIFFTADTHFGHRSLIGEKPFGTKRLYKTIEEMDEDLIKRWNRIVSPRDTVYHLGDFKLHPHLSIKHYLQKLNGKVHLIRGNHDNNSGNLSLCGFKSVSDILEIKICNTIIVLCHYSMRVWPKKHYGSIHLYGHSHGMLDRLPRSFDVGVDCHNYYPISIEQVISLADNF